MESGLYALSNGQPLPPSRASAAVETQRSRGSVELAAVAPATTGAAAASSYDSSRDSGGGGGEAGGRRSTTSPGSKAKGSTQVRSKV